MEIYQINQEVRNALQVEDQEEQKYQLDQLKLTLEEKVENMTMAMRNFETTAVAIDDEIKRLQELKKSAQNRAVTIKKYIHSGMEQQGLKRLEFTNFQLLIAKCPPSVDIQSETDVPAEFWVTKKVHSIDKKKLKDALKEGEVEGAELKQSTSLRIK